MLASSEKILTSLSGVLKDASVIEENFEQEVNENRGEEAAKLLLDDLEKTMRNVPEAESVILKKMQEIQPLHPLIKQIKKGHEDLEQKDEGLLLFYTSILGLGIKTSIKQKIKTQVIESLFS